MTATLYPPLFLSSAQTTASLEGNDIYLVSALVWSQVCLTLKSQFARNLFLFFHLFALRCSSYVGRIGGQQTISVGNADGSITCKHGNLVHEIAHSLGFFHEHSRPDRDQYVEIKWGNIEMGECGRNFRQVTVAL